MNIINGFSATRRELSPNSMASIVETIGTDQFSARFFAVLHEICGAEHCALYRITSDAMRALGAVSLDGRGAAERMVLRYVTDGHWRRDPTIPEARRCEKSPVLIRLDPSQIRDRTFRDAIYAPTRIRERVMICGRRAEDLYGFSVLKSYDQGAFDDDAISELGRSANVLLSALAKHTEFSRQVRATSAAALAAIPDIETRLSATTIKFSPRERQVCARILFGLTTGGIALDLAIKMESVATYRKRVYQRLGIAGRHELLRWYLEA